MAHQITVSKATLFNEEFIKKHDIHIGDTLVIELAGDVIPKVVGKAILDENGMPMKDATGHYLHR